MNISLARKVLIVLLISGTLITSIAVTGQTFATTKNQPDIGIDDGLTTEGGAEDEEPTDESGDEPTSERVLPPPGQRFCEPGTGGDTGKPCIPCDPRPTIGVGCIDTRLGAPLIQRDETESEEGGVMSTDIVEELMASNDTEKKVEMIFGDLENKGEVPPKTAETINSLFSEDTEESLNAIGTLCETASASENFDKGSIDCSGFETSGGESSNEPTTIASKEKAFEIIIVYLAEKMLDNLDAVDFQGMAKWCIQNPGKCT